MSSTIRIYNHQNSWLLGGTYVGKQCVECSRWESIDAQSRFLDYFFLDSTIIRQINSFAVTPHASPCGLIYRRGVNQESFAKSSGILPLHSTLECLFPVGRCVLRSVLRLGICESATTQAHSRLGEDRLKTSQSQAIDWVLNCCCCCLPGLRRISTSIPKSRRPAHSALQTTYS